MTSKLIKGKALSTAQVQQVKAAFVHRLTVENGYPQRNPCGASVAPITDAEWIAQRAFYIKRDGNLASKPSYCESEYLADPIIY